MGNVERAQSHNLNNGFSNMYRFSYNIHSACSQLHLLASIIEVWGKLLRSINEQHLGVISTFARQNLSRMMGISDEGVFTPICSVCVHYC